MTETDATIQSLIRDAERAEFALASEWTRPPRVRRAAAPAAPAAVETPAPAPAPAPPGVLATREAQVAYITAAYVDAAGNAHGGRFTLVSRASGARYTYRVRPPSEKPAAGGECRKCEGSGLWQHRRGYPCFACQGSGETGPRPEGAPERLFVAVLTGSDNTADYTYLGSIVMRPHCRWEHGRKSRISPDAASAKALAWYLSRLFGTGDLSPVEVWHDGTCGRCGRDLTDPESVARGIGPDCADRMGI